MQDVSIRASQRVRQWLAVFSPDEEKAMVGLATMANHQFSELTGKVGVVSEKMQGFPEKLANIRISARDSTRNYFGQITIISDDSIEIRERDDLFPRDDQT